jgi:maleate cis-trans isomerase
MTYRPYGWRARIGLIVPETNTVNEPEWARMAPDGVSIHVARMPLEGDVDAAVAQLVPARPDVIAYGCTAGSLHPPMDRVRELRGVPAIATAPALVRALQAFGVRRIALATPYDDALNRHEIDFFSRHGIETCCCKGLGIGVGGPHEYGAIAQVSKEAAMAHARSADHPAADALVISCTDLATLEGLPALERDIGKPVISSNLATWWLALRTAGVADPDPRHGRLLAEH